jgi:hypothetical protein
VRTSKKILVSLLLTLVFASLLVACGDETVLSTPTASPTDTVDPSTPTPVFTPVPTVRTAAGQIIATGETGEVNNVFVTLNSIRRTSEAPTPPAERSEFVIINLTFENKNKEPIKVGFETDEVLVWDEDGGVFPKTAAVPVQPPNLALETVTIDPDAKQTGEMAFELPIASEGLTVQYQIRTPLGKGTVQLKLDK